VVSIQPGRHNPVMEAVKAAHCYDGQRFRPEGVTLVIERDQILGVEPLSYDVPDGVEVTTYDGTLLPGLVDAHVHLVSDASVGSLERSGSASDEELDAIISAMLAMQAAAGVTTVRDLGDRRYRTLVARDRRSPRGAPNRRGRTALDRAGRPLPLPRWGGRRCGRRTRGRP
jgi:imidazolonepropionase-like amidohydrolase